jgi:exosome complex component RRP42
MSLPSFTLSQKLRHPRRKSWLLSLVVIVLSGLGSVYDPLFLAARSTLWDIKVPKTGNIQYQRKPNAAGDQEVKMNAREVTKPADSELADYWDEGEPFEISQQWPVCVTLNPASDMISVG